MNLKQSILKNGWSKVAIALALAIGALTAATGCDYDDLFGSGFRLGNFNQGLSWQVDCRRNPMDPRC